MRIRLPKIEGETAVLSVDSRETGREAGGGGATSPPAAGLYRRTLGDGAYDRLPPTLRRFHDLPNGGNARGTLRVTRGAGWLRAAVARVMPLPRPGDAVPVMVRVDVEGDAERWTRDFGARRLVTRQWRDARSGFLLEAAGPLVMGFRLTADATGMRFDMARCWLAGGIPLPAALSPRVTAHTSGADGGGDAAWWVSVRVDLPLLGTVTHYEGRVTPTW